MTLILRPFMIFIIMMIPILLFYLIIGLFGLIDKNDLFESKYQMKISILKQILTLIVLSVIIEIILKKYNYKFSYTLPFITTLLFMLYISIKKFKKVRLYEIYGYDSKIEFLYEILFIGLQLTLAIILGKIAAENNMELSIKYYYISICTYILFKLIFLICGKNFSKKECLKNIIIFILSFVISSIVFSINGLSFLVDNSKLLWITYFSLAGSEGFFYWIAKYLKKK